jgi:hypothetical protein
MLQLGIVVWGFAQASVNPKGTGTISLSYQNVFVNKHLFGSGQNYNAAGISALGEVRTHAVFFNVEYSITDRLAISGAIPYISSKYCCGTPGNGPHLYHEPGLLPNSTADDILVTNPDGTPYIPLDDGKYHGAFQDVSLRLRYNAIADPLLVTPFIEYSAPSHGYPFFAHVVVGSRVSEFRIGTYVGRSMDPFLPNAYIQGRYAFGIAQRILGISRTRHQAEVEVGYSIAEPMAVFGVVVGEVTNGGLNLGGGDDFGPMPNRSYNPKFYHHLQVSRNNLLDVGLGLQYSLNDRMSLFGVVLHTITARNMHAIDYALTFGISWAFGSTPLRPCNC